MTSQPEKPVVGQELFVTFANPRKNPERLIVLKVGRVWAELGRSSASSVAYRMSLADWSLNGGGYASPGHAYINEEAYLAVRRVSETWKKFYGKLGYQQPANVTQEAIEEAARLLGLSLE